MQMIFGNVGSDGNHAIFKALEGPSCGKIFLKLPEEVAGKESGEVFNAVSVHMPIELAFFPTDLLADTLDENNSGDVF